MAIINKKPRVGKIIIDISGPDGNAYCLLATAKSFAKQIGIPVEPILNEMTAGDYENLLLCFDKHFDSICDLAR